jgi:hypothetical protein
MTPVKLDPSKKKTVTVNMKQGNITSAYEWYLNETLKITENSVTVKVPSGEVRIVEFKTQ